MLKDIWINIWRCRFKSPVAAQNSNQKNWKNYKKLMNHKKMINNKPIKMKHNFSKKYMARKFWKYLSFSMNKNISLNNSNISFHSFHICRTWRQIFRKEAHLYRWNSSEITWKLFATILKSWMKLIRIDWIKYNNSIQKG